MKFIFVLLINSFLIPLSWGATCRNDYGTCYAADGGNGCSMDNRACFIVADGQCYKIINSTGQRMFVPAKAGSGNWAQFYTNVPTQAPAPAGGVSKTTECFP